MEMTELVSRFRLASRDIRNRYFHPPDWDENEWDVVEWFEEVERSLFESLVLCPAGLDNIDYGTPNPNIVVALTTVGVPIMVNRERGGASGYWDHPVKTIDTSATLIFVKFFDWDQIAYRDHRYVHVVIAGHPSADLVGRHALIETQYVSYTKASAV